MNLFAILRPFDDGLIIAHNAMGLWFLWLIADGPCCVRHIG